MNQKADLKSVTIYTDGACLGNPGPGGYGVVLLYDPHRKELSAGYRRTTNNRMELMAAIAGLRRLKQPCRVVLYTDSRYLADSLMKGWAQRWRANGWRRKSKPVPNTDLWKQMLELWEYHEIRVEWVPGHAGIPENERCDALSMQAAKGANLPPDPGYEQSGQSGARELWQSDETC